MTVAFLDPNLWTVKQAWDDLLRSIDMNTAQIRKEERRTDKLYDERQATITYLQQEIQHTNRMIHLLNDAVQIYIGEVGATGWEHASRTVSPEPHG